MSRFKTKEYQDVFKMTSARYRLKGKERILWKGKNVLTCYFTIVFILLCLVSIGTMLYILFNESVEEPNTLYILLILSPMIFPVLLIIPFGIYFHKKKKAFRSNRKPIDTNEFIIRSLHLDKNRFDIIKASRDTLGALYELDSSLIYPTDTPEIVDLIKSSRNYLPPFQFEFLLDTAKRSGILLSDKEVDRIGSRLSENAQTAETLIGIMCDELTAAQKQQQEMLQNQTFENKLADIEQEEPLKDLPTKSWKQRLILPAGLAVMFFVLGMLAILDGKYKETLEAKLIMFFLIGMVIFGFIIGWLIQFIIAIINKYERLRKVKNSICFSFFCMLIVVFHKDESQEKSYDTDLLVNTLIAGVCGFLIARIAYRLGKRIDTYLKNKSNISEEEKKRIDKDLKYLIDKSPSKLYFKSTVSYMIENNENLRTIPQTKILPGIEGYDKAEPPLYGELANWLKELVDLEPRPYQTVQQKAIPLNLGDKKQKSYVNLNIEFNDTDPQPYLRLQMEDKEITNPVFPANAKCQWALQNRPPMGALKPASNFGDYIYHFRLFPQGLF